MEVKNKQVICYFSFYKSLSTFWKQHFEKIKIMISKTTEYTFNEVHV